MAAEYTRIFAVINCLFILLSGCHMVEHNLSKSPDREYDITADAQAEYKVLDTDQVRPADELFTCGKVILRWSRPYLASSVEITEKTGKDVAPFVGGLIQFSDGTNIHLGHIDDHTIPHFSIDEEITFDSKMVVWIEIYVTSNKQGEIPIENISVRGRPYHGICEKEKPFRWSTPIPADCPFAKSEAFEGIEFTGRFRNYTHGDTWYPSWAADGNLYSPWTDGYIQNAHEFSLFDISHPGYACHSCNIMGKKAATAQAKIVGDDPMDLQIVNIPPRIEGDPSPYGGRYPCGSLVHNGVWYYGTYCLTHTGYCGGVGWTEFGPFVGFRYSTDYGRTWTDTPCTPEKPLFGENPNVAKVKIGAPHFVDFGKNMQHSPDGMAYLVAHGSSEKDAWNNWIQGDHVYLLRVKPSPQTINDSKAYSFFAGYDDDAKAIWTDDFDQMRPLLSWPGHLGCVTVTYNIALEKFFMFITRGVRHDWFDTMVLESDQLAGPWSIIEYLAGFGPVAYFVNMPTKFISGDGRTGWICYSANFHNVWPQRHTLGNPPGSHYSMSLHEIRFRPME